MLAGSLCSFSDSFHRLLCSVLEELERCIGCGLRSACSALVKLALEIAVQRAYYALLGVGEEEALRRISVRSRGAASFTASMVKGLRGVHGSRKSWIMRVYLAVSEYVHPSRRLHGQGSTSMIPGELLREALDVVAYLEALTGVSIDVGLASSCGFEKTLRLMLRRGS